MKDVLTAISVIMTDTAPSSFSSTLKIPVTALEFVVEKYGNKCIIELKWGQGAKDIGGEIQVTSLDYALFLKDRGYVVDPDPRLPEVQKAFKKGAIKSFARHSRLGGTNLDGALHPERKEKLCGNWDSLPKTVSDIGNSAEEIFAAYFKLVRIKFSTCY